MRLVLDSRARALLRRVPVTTVYSGVELVLIALFAVQCARLVWAVVTPVGPVGLWRPEQSGLAGSPQAILHGFDPFFRISGGDAAASVVTDLQLTLYGTRIDEAQGGGSAIIAGPDGVQQSVGVGQEIVPGVRLKSVSFDHVTIDRGGAAQDLFIVQPEQAAVAPVAPSAAPLVGGSPNAPAAPPPPSTTGPRGLTVAQLRSDVGFIPRIDGGRITGLTVRSQGSGAGFRAAGLREGDIVTQIGGKPVSGAGDIERLGAQYAKGGTLSITVERDANTFPLVITIAGQ